MPRKFKVKPPPLNLGNETNGQRIARFRKERGYTQAELAKKIGIENYLVSEYERGRLRMNDEMVTRFAIALEVSTDEILGLEKTNHADIKPSLRIIRRLKKIEELPLSKQKSLLQTIDGFLKGEGINH